MKTRIWIDCEWNSYKGALISFACVTDDGRNFYQEVVLHEPPHPWVAANVLPHLRGDVVEYVMNTQKLPPWPKKEKYEDPGYPGNFLDPMAAASYYEALAEAALARLREAKAWLERAPHVNGCAMTWPKPVVGQRRCTCGLDKFIADMLPEEEEE